MSEIGNPAEELATAILSRRITRLEGLSSAYPRKNSILSDIGDCERQMVYSVLDWDKRPVAGPDLQARFEAGKTFERDVVRELLDMGFDFQQSQAPVQIRNRAGEIIATGKIDGFIKFDGRRIPVEIKSMHPQVFNGIKSVEDFRKKPWLRKYTRQLMAYLFGNNEEFGIFIMGDLLGHWKMLPLTLDFGDAEAILQRLERVHEAIKAKRYPDRIIYDQSICGKCPFSAMCLQDIINRPTDFIDNESLALEIERHEELKPLSAEYEELHEKIKDTFKSVEKAVVSGRWMVQMIPSERTKYDLTPEAEAQIAEIKAAHAVKVPMRRLVIEEIGK